MVDNLFLGLEAQVNHALGVMRAANQRNILVNGMELVPGIFFSVDQQGEVSGSYVAGGENLLELDYTVTAAPKWLALHLQVGGIDFRSSMVIGIVCRSSSMEALTFRCCLRSEAHNGFVDALFPKHVISFGSPSTHLDLLKIFEREDVPLRATWRELIFFFPTKTSRFQIQDLRVFIV